MIRVGIIGATGYAGGELVRILLNRIANQTVLQSLTAVDGYIFHVGIHVHDTHCHVIASAHVIQLPGEFLGTIAVALRRLLDRLISIVNDIQLALHIDSA